MTITPEAERRIREKKKLIQQFIIDPKFLVPDVHIEPFTPHLQTNSFVQRSLDHLLGRRLDTDKWTSIAVDDEGKLVLSDNLDYAGWTKIADRECATFKVFNNVNLPGLGLLSHGGVDISGFQEVSFAISTNVGCTIYLQYSDNNTDWYDLKAVDDTDRSWSCNDEKIFVTGSVAARFMRLVIYNTTGNTATITGVITGRV